MERTLRIQISRFLKIQNCVVGNVLGVPMLLCGFVQQTTKKNKLTLISEKNLHGSAGGDELRLWLADTSTLVDLLTNFGNSFKGLESWSPKMPLIFNSTLNKLISN